MKGKTKHLTEQVREALLALSDTVLMETLGMLKGIIMENFDRDKVDEIVLALMQLTLHDNYRAWKGFDWETLNRLHEKGLIENPIGKAKSVVLTETGLEKSAALFERYFGSPSEAPLPATSSRKRSIDPEVYRH